MRFAAAFVFAVILPVQAAAGSALAARVIEESQFLAPGVVQEAPAAPAAAQGAPAPAAAHEALRWIAGCFEVTYHYEEPGKKNYDVKSLEWIAMEGKPDGSFFFQQALLLTDDQGKIEIMKHWAQRWTPTKTGWKQEVLGPSGRLRYDCAEGLTFGLRVPGGKEREYLRLCRAQGTPKPVRDAKRADYDVLDRVHEVSYKASGWTDSQENVKRKNDGTEVAKEKGVNEYKRVDEARCAEAKKNPPQD